MSKIEDKEYLNYSDVLIKPKRSNIASRKDVTLERVFFNHNKKRTFEGVPILVANMDTTGTIKMALEVQKYGLAVALHKFHSDKELSDAYDNGLSYNHFISIGQGETELDKFQGPYDWGVKNLMIDVANGYREDFFTFLNKARDRFPNAYIAAGNVCTPEILRNYRVAGINAVKIGIGPGGQCRTRETTGIGIPQLTAVMDCANEADYLGLHIIADGGINEYADFAKAFGAGADFVMAGSFFGGHHECDGIVKTDEAGQYMELYGMSSHRAQQKHYGEVSDYRASEGRVSRIPYKGPVKKTIEEILGSLRSTMTYTNTRNILNLEENVTFIKVKDTINRKYEEFTIGI